MNPLNSGFASLSDVDFLARGLGIVSALSKPPGSSLFPTAAAMVAELETLLGDFTRTIHLGNAPGAKVKRANARAAAAEKIQRLAVLLAAVSTDRAKLAHTGFPLRKSWTRDRRPTATPQNVKAMPTGLPGGAKLSATGIRNALAYEARATRDMASGVFTACHPATAIRKLRFTGLERGKDWFFQIRAISPNGPGPWSDPAMMMVV
jgi:hypothetical protein